MRHAALLAAALTLAPVIAQAVEMPVCPIQPGALICSTADPLEKVAHRALEDASYPKERAAALASGKCRSVVDPTPTVAVRFEEMLTNQGDIIKVRTAAEPNKWQFVSVYLMYENPRDFYFGGVKCGLHPKMQDYEIN